MDQIQPVLARRDEADLGAGLAPDLVVDLVGARKRLGRPAFIVDHPRLGRDGRVMQADVQPAFRHLEIRGDEGQPERIAVHDRGSLDPVLHGLQPGPDAREPRQRKGIQAIVQDFLHPRRRQHRDIAVDHRPIGLVQHGTAFAGMVVAHGHHHAAMRGRPGHVGVPHHVARPVHARPLAIPQREDAVVFALAAQFRLLAAPDGGGGQILVQARLEQDVRLAQPFAFAHHLQIDAAQGRSAIARDKACRVQPRRLVARRLHQHQPDQGLRAVQQHLRLGQVEPVG